MARGLFIFACSIFTALIAHGEGATAPASRPSGPKQLLVETHTAMLAEDTAGVMKLYLWAGPDQEKVARACVANAISSARLEKATREKFGDDVVAAVMHRLNLPTTEDIARADEVVNDRGAVVRYKTPDLFPMKLELIDGSWGVSIGRMVKGFDKDGIRDACASTANMTRQIGWMAEQVRDDQFKSAEDLKEAAGRLGDALQRGQ